MGKVRFLSSQDVSFEAPELSETADGLGVGHASSTSFVESFRSGGTESGASASISTSVTIATIQQDGWKGIRVNVKFSEADQKRETKITESNKYEFSRLELVGRLD